MAHFVRPLALAESLDAARYDVHFYAPRRYSRYLHNKTFATGELASMPGERFLENLSKGRPLFPAGTIRDYVGQDRKLIRELRPDLVIGDMRLSLPISARLEGSLYAIIFNAYWSPFAKPRTVVPSMPLTRFLPPRWFGAVYRATEPLVNRLHAGEMNTVRREFGIPDLPPDFRVMYTEGDHVLYADVPEFTPTFHPPKNHHYIGICDWTPPVETPGWWDRMISDPKRKVFVSLGSSGPLQALPALLCALAKLPVSVVISTSGRQMTAEPGAYTADLLPFTDTAKASAIVVSHGGSGGVYPAIAAGTPVLGIPSNADQHLSAAILEESGAGLSIRVEEASETRLLQALEKLLTEPQYSRKASEWKTVFARYDSGELFRKFLDETLGEGVPAV